MGRGEERGKREGIKEGKGREGTKGGRGREEKGDEPFFPFQLKFLAMRLVTGMMCV